jgi:thioredoxin reductase
MAYEVIVVGASFGGLSAAMQLARAGKRLLLVDAGRPRNRFATASHGFLGQDGVAPAEIMRRGLEQLSAYPTVDFVHGVAEHASGAKDEFAVGLSTGEQIDARRLVLATGLRDELPAVPGLAERWGVSVLHCPYCHGYEMLGRPLGVLAKDARSAHKAVLISDWGPTTYFTQGLEDPDAETLARLAARGVSVERSPVVELAGEGAALSEVRLADGRTRPIAALFVTSETAPASPLAEQLGCAFVEGPLGRYLETDDWRQTSVAGVYAAGDLAIPMHNATLASASGVMAGVGAHQSLL